MALTTANEDSIILPRVGDPGPPISPSQMAPSRSKKQNPEPAPREYIPTRNGSISSLGTNAPLPPSLRSSSIAVPGAVPVPGMIAPHAHVVPTPLLNASLVGEDDGDYAVFAEPMNAVIRKSPYLFFPSLKDRRCMIFVGIMMLAIVCFTTGVSLVLGAEDNSTASDQLGDNAIPHVTQVPTLQPTEFPTEHLDFDPPSHEECMDISDGKALPGQEEMIMKNFQVEMDVVLETQNDVAPLLDNLREHMQAILAPALVACDDIFHHLLRKRGRQLQMDYVVANALFDVVVPNGRLCKKDTPEPCHRVIANLDLYVNEDEKIVKLIGLIMSVFDDESLVDRLDLDSPFVSIEMVGVMSNNPTLAPTAAPMVVTDKPVRIPTSPPSRMTPQPVRDFYEDEDDEVDSDNDDETRFFGW